MKLSKNIVFIGLAGLGLFLTACGQGAVTSKSSKSSGPDGKKVSIVGSSTVFPFASIAAERFAASNPGATPKVEQTGTGGGIKIFCEGTGANTPDIATASRQIKKSEFEECAKNGVTEIVELKIGFDGIVLANAKTGSKMAISNKELFLAIAKEVPVDGKLIANPYQKWNQINPSFPDKKIDIMGPPPTSGTRDAVTELIMEKGAKELPFLKALSESDKEGFKKVAHSVREDGNWRDMGENDNIIVQTLVSTPDAFGLFGYSFFEENKDRIQAATIEGQAPTSENIISGKYSAARSLYIYVKKQKASLIASLKPFVTSFLSTAAIGDKGYLVAKGLIPLPAADLAASQKAAADMTPMTKPEK